MRRVVSSAATLSLLSAVLFAGCAETPKAVRENRGTAIGAGAGAVGGAAAGAILGGKRGAIAGGLLGALAGGIVGRYYDEKEKSLAQAQADHGYAADQRTRLKIESVRANPAALSPGETVNIHLTYAVLAPQEDVLVPVRETRQIFHDGKSVGETAIDVERRGGTWRSTVPITLPDDAAAGNYTVAASVEIRGAAKEVSEAIFSVR